MCRYGEAGLKGMGGMGGGTRGGDPFQNPFDIFSEFFGASAGDVFGGAGGRGRPRAQPGNDERYDLVLDFNEAIFGCRYLNALYVLSVVEAKAA